MLFYRPPTPLKSDDPHKLYRIRKLLLLAAERLDAAGATRLETALAAGDPYEEVGCTHVAKELLRSVYAAGDIYAARTALGRFYDWAATVQIPEVTRLATTIDRWSDEVLAYYRTGRASSVPVEAINGEIEDVDRSRLPALPPLPDPDAAQDRGLLAHSPHPKNPGPRRSIRPRHPRVHRVGPPKHAERRAPT